MSPEKLTTFDASEFDMPDDAIAQTVANVNTESIASYDEYTVYTDYSDYGILF